MKKAVFLSNTTERADTTEFGYTEVIADLDKRNFRGGLAGESYWPEKRKRRERECKQLSIGFIVKGRGKMC